MGNNLQIMIVGAGCFWCMEAVFNEIRGVEKVVSGFMGGTVPGKPTYREVCSGLTGHAEVVQIWFNESDISYTDLLHFFFAIHDATLSYARKNLGTYGSQYRSVLFYKSESQKATAEYVIHELQERNPKPILTEVKLATLFHEAELEHQDYYKNNPNASYCMTIIVPKLGILHQKFSEKLKYSNCLLSNSMNIK
ncbi:peptide-methionine (S)-S-oxide reductase MsrA [Bizionia myxarmorum]|uniref:Peptide methionine sulfoxide reductase MsrA n=1 Tax=Bizionia myxarmorum TaxID=291186 RepID=A0A5D0RC33_9FLAO|nr:peptide-methionine (S)-S-oxide reductase MsrA [Bizionia myxarmorum]TYB79107.1 peptide-methionine (S)-S-oxide reductase MsrA [Bizionia myxarmorum]